MILHEHIIFFKGFWTFSMLKEGKNNYCGLLAQHCEITCHNVFFLSFLQSCQASWWRVRYQRGYPI